MGCLQSKEKRVPSKSNLHCNKPQDTTASKKKKFKPSRSSRISVAIKVGTGIRRSKVHATHKRIVCVFGMYDNK